MLSRASSRALLTPWLSPYSHSASRILGSVASRPALPSRALIDSSKRPSASPSSTRQMARAGCSASSSPSRSVGCRISCLRLASRSRTASSITAPPPLHLPPYHPYSTTLLRSLRLKNSQTRRMTAYPYKGIYAVQHWTRRCGGWHHAEQSPAWVALLSSRLCFHGVPREHWKVVRATRRSKATIRFYTCPALHP